MEDQDILEPKYHLDNDAFSIQYMRKKGYSPMAESHFHTNYEIYYLIRGERVYFINGTVYTARSGDLIIINPHDVHRTTSSEVMEFERILINFSHDFIRPEVFAPGMPLLPFPQGSRLLQLPEKERETVERLIREMLHEAKNGKEGGVHYVRALLMELLIRIYRLSGDHALMPIQYAHPMHEKISEIASYLNAHYVGEITLEDIARKFYISPSYLSRIFKKVTGFQFREYLQLVRVKEAQKQLQETRAKIQDIAERVGFEHIAHFNKTFKKWVGVSPLQYRKQFRKDGGRRPVKRGGRTDPPSE
jgi:AraC-like DNA-binding protein